MESTNLIALTADIVAAHLSNNPVATAELPALIASVHGALAKTSAPDVPEAIRAEPAVSIRASIKPDYLVCLEDGRKVRMLKRYLRTKYDLSPDEYRAKWGLPRDYPMAAPNYSEMRRGLAQANGLGRTKRVDTAAPAEPAEETSSPVAEAPTPAKAKRAVAAKKAKPASVKPRGIAAAKAAAQAHLGDTSEPSTDAPPADVPEIASEA